MNVFFLVAIFFLGCSSKKQTDIKFDIKLDSIPKFANIVVERESPSVLFPILLDSANKFKKEDPIPHFFYNHLLDYEYPWLTDHNSFSLRKLIIDSTTNKEILNSILMSSDPRFKKIADSAEVSSVNLLNALPYKNLSNYDMVQMRLKSINK